MAGGPAEIAYWERNIGRRRHGKKLLGALSREHQVWMQCLLGAEGTNDFIKKRRLAVGGKPCIDVRQLATHYYWIPALSKENPSECDENPSQWDILPF